LNLLFILEADDLCFHAFRYSVLLADTSEANNASDASNAANSSDSTLTADPSNCEMELSIIRLSALGCNPFEVGCTYRQPSGIGALELGWLEPLYFLM